MPAEVDQMFSVREVPWHREGEVLADYPNSWEAARVLAGLDWDPEPFDVYRSDLDDDALRVQIARIMLGTDGTEGEKIDRVVRMVRETAYPAIDGWQRVGRDDDPTKTLACTKASYEVIRHSAFGEILEAVLEQDRDNLRVETGGSLAGGTKVWMLVRLDEPIAVKGDRSLTMPYVALTSRHDAGGSTAARATMVRIVCANTFRAAEAEGDRTGLTFSFRHTKNWRDHVEDARDAIRGVRREIREYVEIANELLGIPVTAGQTELFVREFIPTPPEGLITERVSRNIEEARTALRAILGSTTVEGAGIDGTAFGLIQGAVEYLDHVRTARTWETRLNRTIIKPERIKAKATRLAREVALADA